MASEHQNERRGAPRKRALKKGMIVFKDRYCSTECMIRNESDDGALLMVSQNQIIPSHIEIRAYPNPAYRPAEVVWRTTEAMGIRYLDRAPQYQPAPAANQAAPQPAEVQTHAAPAMHPVEPAQPIHPAPPMAPVATSPAPEEEAERPPVYVEPSAERPKGWDGFERRVGDRRRVRRPGE